MKILLIEPFLLESCADKANFREDLDPKIQACRKAARELADAFLPMDGIFAAACVYREPAFWSADGVHPLPAGHALIAQKWIDLALA